MATATRAKSQRRGEAHLKEARKIVPDRGCGPGFTSFNPGCVQVGAAVVCEQTEMEDVP